MRLAFWRTSKDKAPEEMPSVAEATPAVEARFVGSRSVESGL